MEPNDYLKLFIDESNEHLQMLNDSLLKLEQQPEDYACIQAIFRSAHTLKGMSASMGFSDMAALTHEMENVLDLIRNSTLSMTPELFEMLFFSLDELTLMLADITNGGNGEKDISQLTQALQVISATKEIAVSGVKHNQNELITIDHYHYSVLKESLAMGYYAYEMVVTVAESCLLKAVRVFMVFDTLEHHGEIIHSSPSAQELEQGQMDQSLCMLYITKLEQSLIIDHVMSISEIERVDVQVIVEKDLENRLTATVSPVVERKHQQTEINKTSQTFANTTSRTIRVDVQRLDLLMNLYSEWMIDRLRLEQISKELNHEALKETVEHVQRISTDMQNVISTLRLVPIETVFNRFPRMIRDLSKSLNKKIELVILGAQTELDRTIVDEIGDPLVHLLRNCVDHGIESTENRLAAGKQEAGTITLHAYQYGQHVIIDVKDDGGGINPRKIVKAIIDKGLLSKEEADQLSDDEIVQYLFHAGFSTADKVTDISGRGVGLDVVKNKIMTLGGDVTVQSELTVGTTFTIQLPMTLSIIGAMIIKLGAETYCIPVSSIAETMVVTQNQIHYVQQQAMFDYRHSIIPLISLGEILQCPKTNEENVSEEFYVVVIRKGDQCIALIVDELLNQEEIVFKQLGTYLNDVKNMLGATILGNGEVALIIDPNTLFR